MFSISIYEIRFIFLDTCWSSCIRQVYISLMYAYFK